MTENLVVMTPEQLNIAIADAVEKALKGAARKTQVEEPELLTEKDVMRKLSTTHTSLWRWNKTGYLTIVKVGGKSRWRKEDVLKLMGGCN